MKKNIIITIILLFFIGLILLIGINLNHKKDSNLAKIKVAEVAHTIFYAPQYVAINNGYFKEEGIEINLTLTSGADKVAAALLSKDADIGLSGSEATIYVYNNGEKDYLKTFAAITQKDGSFLVSREKINNFTLNNLKGKNVIGGRIAGMPEMTFEWALRQNNINPEKDLTINTSIAFAAMSGAFIGGEGDFVTLFEPTASEIEQQGYGYVVASVGELGGIVPYTSYSARRSYINENKEIINKFNNAIQKGLDYVNNNSDEDVAKSILSFFPDTALNDIEKAIKRYRGIEAWPNTTTFSKESFDHLQEIMKSANAIKDTVNYYDLSYDVNG